MGGRSFRMVVIDEATQVGLLAAAWHLTLAHALRRCPALLCAGRPCHVRFEKQGGLVWTSTVPPTLSRRRCPAVRA
eukprot:365313-Chlamydomonas_euryale.AAC.39